jgi:hypothetical protein
MLLLLLAVAGAVDADEDLDEKLILRGRHEADTLWRRGYTLGVDSLSADLDSLVQRLTAGAEHPEAIQLQVHILRSPVLNAFALPDGSLFICTGLLASLDGFDELAFVLGHESQHALGLHAQRYIDQAEDKSAIWEGLSLVVGVATGGTWGGLFAQMGLTLAAAASVSGYGRGLESEADEAGMAFLESAGFEPCAGVRALEALRRDSGDPNAVANFFWGSHPRLSDRIEDIQNDRSIDCEVDAIGGSDEDYACAFKWPMTRLSAELWLNEGRPDKARPWAEHYAEVYPQKVEAQLLLGKVHLGYHEAMEAIASGELDPPKDEYIRADLAQHGEGALPRANAAFMNALELGGEDCKPALLGLALTYEAEGDTTSCVEYLRRYLDGDERVPRRRAMQRKLRAYAETTDAQAGVVTEPD